MIYKSPLAVIQKWLETKSVTDIIVDKLYLFVIDLKSGAIQKVIHTNDDYNLSLSFNSDADIEQYYVEILNKSGVDCENAELAQDHVSDIIAYPTAFYFRDGIRINLTGHDFLNLSKFKTELTETEFINPYSLI